MINISRKKQNERNMDFPYLTNKSQWCTNIKSNFMATIFKHLRVKKKHHIVSIQENMYYRGQIEKKKK